MFSKCELIVDKKQLNENTTIYKQIDIVFIHITNIQLVHTCLYIIDMDTVFHAFLFTLYLSYIHTNIPWYISTNRAYRNV